MVTKRKATKPAASVTNNTVNFGGCATAEEAQRMAMKDLHAHRYQVECPANFQDPGREIDELGVEELAAAMKAKLLQKRIEGRSGWDNPARCLVANLANQFIDHLAKGDLIDLANYLMMLNHRAGGSDALRKAFERRDLLRDQELTALGEKLRTVRRQRDTECAAVAERTRERDKAQGNLQRALGYIDRVNEDREPAAVRQPDGYSGIVLRQPGPYID